MNALIRHRDTVLGTDKATALPLLSLAGFCGRARVVALGGAVLTVKTDTAGFEERLGSGGLACPGWGRAR
jgi:hypothetical protein